MNFPEELKNNSINLWNEILENKLIMELSNDTLPNEKFIAYLLQDRLFLKEFCILLEKGMKLTQNDNIRKWLGELIQNTTEVELKMQNELLELLHYTEHDTTIPSLPNKSTLDYISDMKSLTGEHATIYQLVSFIAPCPWTYYEIAEKIKKKNVVKDKATIKWVDFYSSFESKQQVDFVVHLLNEVSMGLTHQEKSDMKSYFNKACTNELNFWNMAYNHKGI